MILKNYISEDLTIILAKLSYILLIIILLPLISISLLCNTTKHQIVPYQTQLFPPLIHLSFLPSSPPNQWCFSYQPMIKTES